MRQTKAELCAEIARLEKRLTGLEGSRDGRAALDDGAARFRDFAGQAAEWFWEMDSELRFTHFSDRFHEATGIDPKEYYGKTREEIGIAKADKTHWAKLRRMLEAREAFQDFTYPRHGMGGDVRHIRLSGKPVFAADGAFMGYRGVGSEISHEIAAGLAVRDSQKQLASIASNLPGIIYRRVLHADGSISFPFVSDKLAETFGIDAQDAIADPGLFVDAIHPDDLDHWRKMIDRSARDLTPFDIEHRIVTPQGAVRWTRSIALAHEGENGDIIWDGMALDITERKQATFELEESEARFRDFANAASDWFWETDEEHRFSFFSNRIAEAQSIERERYYGATREELAYKSDDPPEKWAKHRAALDAHEPFSDFTFQIEGPDGRIRNIRSSGVPVFDEDGAFKGYRGTARDISLEVAASNALRQSEARLKGIIDNAPLLIALKDVKGRCVISNRRYCQTYGIAPSEIAGKTVHDMFPKGLADDYWAHEQRVLESGQASTEPFVNPTVDGERILLETKFPIRDDSGEIVGLGFVGMDITEREQAEQALRVKSQQVDIALSNITQGLTLYDGDQRLVLCNQRYLDMYGLSAEVVRPGCSLRETMEHSLALGNYDPMDGKKVIAARLDMVRTGKRGTLLQKLNNGRIIEVIHQPLPDGGAVATFTDITARARAQEALRLSEERFRDIAEVASDWFWAMDKELRFSYFSGRFAEVTGVDPATIIGKTRHELGWADEDEDKWRQHLREMAQRKPFRDFRYVYKDPDGRPRNWSISGKPIYDGDGAFLGYRGTGTDVSAEMVAAEAQREARETAETASRAKSEFLANMSHELRTPLNAIIGFSEMMKDEMLGPLGNPQYRDYTKDIYDSGNHLLSLINDILDLSKIEAGKFEVEDAKLGIGETVDAALRIVRPRAVEARVNIALDLPGELPFLRADRRAMKQILLNLLSNAVKFTPAGGDVVVSSRVDERGGIEIAVADTGIGIEKKDIEIVMSAFGQVDSTYTRTNQGTGLGLPLVKALVELHGGELDIDSAPGVGTTVTVHMPAARTILSSPAAAPRTARGY